jgi:hypothetical protein
MRPWLGFDPLSLYPARLLGRMSASNRIDKTVAAIKDVGCDVHTWVASKKEKHAIADGSAWCTKPTSETESECLLAFAGTDFTWSYSGCERRQ